MGKGLIYIIECTILVLSYIGILYYRKLWDMKIRLLVLIFNISYTMIPVFYHIAIN